MKEKYLKLEVIWKNLYMCQLEITASNGRYCGVTKVYEVKQNILPFANKLYKFPKHSTNLTYENGKRNDEHFNYFMMNIKQQGGVASIRIILEENCGDGYRIEKNNIVELEFIVEGASIDRFQNELVYLAENGKGKAKLQGRSILG